MRQHIGPVARWGLAVVRGRSMQPTLHDGDVLLVRYGVPARVGGLAVVRFPAARLQRPVDVVAVKRVTARSPDGWWVERDNPAEGVDSWLVGALSDDQVLARVLVRVWPLRRRS